MPIPAGPSDAIVTLEDARAHLNFLPGDTDDDTELQGFIDAATTWAERNYGPLLGTSYTETQTPSRDGIPLNHWPVVSVTSVVGAYGYTATYDVATLHVTDAGILAPNIGAAWFTGYPLTITYVAGLAEVTEDVRKGVLEVLAGLWETQHGGGTGGPEALLQAAGEDELVANMGLRYWRADMLLRSYRAPVVA